MRAKSLALLALALGCGLVASMGITQVLAKRGIIESRPASGEAAAIYVAMKDIAQGDALNAQSLKLEQWPKDKVPPGGLNHADDVDGRRTRTRLYAGEPILDNLLLPKGVNQQTAGGMIPMGYRVVSIRVDAVSGGGNLVLPGDRVDLLVHMGRNESIGIHETTTRTILQDIRVFAVNDVMNLEANGDTKSIQARTVSLLVTPEQAEKVTLATELGTIKLVMRSPEDAAQPKTAGALPRQLLGLTERTEREKGNLSGDPDLDKAKQQAQEFREFREAARKEAAVQKAASAEAAKNTWAMRILSGSAIKDVTLESADGQAATDPGGWKVNGATSTGSPPAAEIKTLPPSQEQKPVEEKKSPWGNQRAAS
jgi:pilus assembly protein CpaB